MNPGLAAQVSDQTHKAIEPVVVQDGAIPKQSPMASMQGAVPAADTIARSVRPKSRHGARNTVTLQTESSQQAKVADPVSQGVLQRQMGILSQGGVGQQGRFVVKESTGTPQSQNNVVGEIATSTGTTTIEAVRGGAPEAGSPVRQISEAFQSSAARNGQEIVIRLDPPELGRVSVRLRLEGNAVRGILEVENPRTLSQLQREAPNIMNRLTDAGIEMKRMELSLSENSSRDSMRDSMRDSSWFSQQYGENGAGHDGWNSPGYRRQTDETLPEGSDMAGGFQPALTTIGDDSINIWI